MRRMNTVLFSCLLLLLFASSARAVPPADVILHNGKIFTVDSEQPWAQAVAIRGSRILVVGDAVVGNPPARLSLLPDRVIDDPPTLRASLRRVLALDFDALVVGDGVAILADARDRLRELVAEFPRD